MSARREDPSSQVHPLLARRWSPRSFDPSGEVGERTLLILLEAARWAPSFGNTQPARYLVGRRGDDTFRRIFDTLTPRNQSWAGAAAALLLAVAVERNEKGEIPYAEYSVGLATENLVLQATGLGLGAHQMAGFDHEAARAAFDLPEHTRPLVTIAVGVPGDPDLLPEDLRARELAPRRRKPLSDIAFSGEWGSPAF